MTHRKTSFKTHGGSQNQFPQMLEYFFPLLLVSKLDIARWNVIPLGPLTTFSALKFLQVKRPSELNHETPLCCPTWQGNLNQLKCHKIRNSVSLSHQSHFKSSKVTCSSWLLYWTRQTENMPSVHDAIGRCCESDVRAT